MSRSFRVEDPRGARDVGESDFPLSVGGSEADIQLPGVDGSEPVAWIGLTDGQLFVQADAVSVVRGPWIVPMLLSRQARLRQVGIVMRVWTPRLLADAGALSDNTRLTTLALRLLLW